jgi:capsular polysaccharide transport system permease protein
MLRKQPDDDSRKDEAAAGVDDAAVVATATPAAPAAPARPSRFRRLMRRFNGLFAITVLLPTLAAGVYFGAVASDVYISESRFLVRNPQRPQMSGIGALLQGTAFSRAQDDTYSVHDFIKSRDALRELDDKLGVRRAFTSEDIDLFNRFPGLDPDDSFEALHRYYQKHIGITYDSVSSISILQVRAYTAEDAKRINELLLEMGERLVNNMNIRSRRDLIQVAENEVKLAEQRARDAAGALSGFRADRSVFDPDRQGALQLQGVLKLREELMVAENQLAQVRQVSPDNPQIPSLESRVKAIEKAIADENARVLGRAGGLVSKSPAFDRLVLDKAFADRQLAAALTALDQARAEAQRKQLYLERLVQPHLPDNAVEPRRVRSIVTVFVLGLVAWGVLSLVVAGVREHTD